MKEGIEEPCGHKPNCVSTEDTRERFKIMPFLLARDVSIKEIEEIALKLFGASLAEKKSFYLRLECRSRIFRFVDDLEIKIIGSRLLIRSESRMGYSDFGINRQRTEQLRVLLKNANLII